MIKHILFLLFISNVVIASENIALKSYDGYSVGGCPDNFSGKKCLNLSHFNFSSFMFEKNTFSDISNKFGTVPGIYKDEKSHDQQICYRAIVNDKKILVEFGTWDHGYKNLAVNEVRITYDNEPKKRYLSCGRMNLSIGSLIPESKVSLGLSREEFNKLLNINNKNNESTVKVQGGYISSDLKLYINQSVRGYFDKDNILIGLMFMIKSEPM